jgi:predicted transcriptional regulator
MAISNELSSEIAAAILAEKKKPQELNQLKDIILRVHAALQKMSEDARARRFKTRSKAATNSGEHHSS